jgi:Zn finger protein HypA/HybF involved in hydrogenase expression
MSTLIDIYCNIPQHETLRCQRCDSVRVLDTSDALESADCTNCTGGGTDIVEGTYVRTF